MKSFSICCKEKGINYNFLVYILNVIVEFEKENGNTLLFKLRSRYVIKCFNFMWVFLKLFALLFSFQITRFQNLHTIIKTCKTVVEFGCLRFIILQNNFFFHSFKIKQVPSWFLELRFNWKVHHLPERFFKYLDGISINL